MIFRQIREAVYDRFAGRPSWIVLIETFIGLGWVRAATEKVIAPEWWNQEVIDTFIARHRELTIPWYSPLLENVWAPRAGLLVFLIPAGQLFAGLSILVARRLHIGIFTGMTMNLNFILIGAVNPSIFYLMLQATLALWLFESRPITALGISYLKWIIGLALLLAIASLPFIKTIDPEHVVEDPAMVLVIYGASIMVTALIALGNLRRTESRKMG